MKRLEVCFYLNHEQSLLVEIGENAENEARRLMGADGAGKVIKTVVLTEDKYEPAFLQFLAGFAELTEQQGFDELFAEIFAAGNLAEMPATVRA